MGGCRDYYFHLILGQCGGCPATSSFNLPVWHGRRKVVISEWLWWLLENDCGLLKNYSGTGPDVVSLLDNRAELLALWRQLLIWQMLVFFFLDTKLTKSTRWSLFSISRISKTHSLASLWPMWLFCCLTRSSLQGPWSSWYFPEHNADILHYWHDEQEVALALDALMRHMYARGWERDSKNSERPATSVKFLGVQWSGKWWHFLSKLKGRFYTLYPPITEKEQQCSLPLDFWDNVQSFWVYWSKPNLSNA